MKPARKTKAAYTLIEILIVLFIISIVTGVAILHVRYNENKQIETFANRFVGLVRLAEEQAMLQPAVLGLSIRYNRFQFSQLKLQAEQREFLVV